MRILIAPHEIAGQMQILATTFRRLGHLATAVNYYEPPWLGYINDVNLGFQSKRRYASRFAKMLTFSAWAALNYDVFHFFYGRSLFNKSQFDLPLLKAMGKKIFVHFRGSDIRDIMRGGDPTRAAQAARPLSQTAGQRARVRTWQKYANGMFVSTAELLKFAPGARLVQQVIDLDEWTVRPADAKPEVIRIAHAPTDRAKKGTAHVIAAVDQLKAKGVPADLVLIEGVSHQQVRSLYSTCHLAVDQLLDGWYGNFSIEMMALAKPVICFIDPRLRPHRPDLPLIDAAPETIADVLGQVVASGSTWAEIGARGRAYVEQYHSARKICTDLLAVYAGT